MKDQGCQAKVEEECLTQNCDSREQCTALRPLKHLVLDGTARASHTSDVLKRRHKLEVMFYIFYTENPQCKLKLSQFMSAGVKSNFRNKFCLI